MKRLGLLTLILGLLSCSASRKVSSSIKTDITDKTEANVTQKRDKDSSGRTESHVTEDSSGTKDKEVVIEKFDTDKPTDPATGTPPLKERTTSGAPANAAANAGHNQDRNPCTRIGFHC